MRLLQNYALILRTLAEEKRNLLNNSNLDAKPRISFCKQVNIAKK